MDYVIEYSSALPRKKFKNENPQYFDFFLSNSDQSSNWLVEAHPMSKSLNLAKVWLKRPGKHPCPGSLIAIYEKTFERVKSAPGERIPN